MAFPDDNGFGETAFDRRREMNMNIIRAREANAIAAAQRKKHIADVIAKQQANAISAGQRRERNAVVITKQKEFAAKKAQRTISGYGYTASNTPIINPYAPMYSGYGNYDYGDFGRSWRKTVSNVVRSVAAPIVHTVQKVAAPITSVVTKVTKPIVKTIINPLENPLKSIAAIALAPIALAPAILAKAKVDLGKMKRQSVGTDPATGQEVVQYQDENGNIITEAQYKELVAKYEAEEKRLTEEQYKQMMAQTQSALPSVSVQAMQPVTQQVMPQQLPSAMPAYTAPSAPSSAPVNVPSVPDASVREQADWYSEEMQEAPSRPASNAPSAQDILRQMKEQAVTIPSFEEEPAGSSASDVSNIWDNVDSNFEGGNDMQGFGKTFEISVSPALRGNFNKPFYNSNYARPLQSGPVNMSGYGEEGGWMDTLANLAAKGKKIAEDVKNVRESLKRPKPAAMPSDATAMQNITVGAPKPQSGIPTYVYIIGGAAVVGLGAFLLMRKRS